METNNNEFNHEAGLKVIYEMIESARSKIGSNYFYYLLWGYLVAFTCVAEYILIKLVDYTQHYLVWPVFMGIGLVVTLLFSLQRKKITGSKTFIGTAMIYLWSSWLVSFLILIGFANLNQDYEMIFPVTLVMYGLVIFIAGGLVDFKPLIIGGVLSWMASVAAFFSPYQVQLVIVFVAVIMAYIIPGHILKNKSKKR
ncbi:MAG: hypothetical protein JXA72_04285 [Bacteroidales bacterium]|nr:hypothetical protein [Bacteroidales bacterium]